MQQLAAKPLEEAEGSTKHPVISLTANSVLRLQRGVDTLAMLNAPNLFPNKIPKDPAGKKNFLERRRLEFKNFFEYTDEEIHSLRMIHKSPSNGPMQAKGVLKSRMLKLKKGKELTTYVDERPQIPLS